MISMLFILYGTLLDLYEDKLTAKDILVELNCNT